MRMSMLVGGEPLTVMAKNMGVSDVAVGMTVRAAGTFRVYRQKIVVEARQCEVIRPEGFEPLYEAARRWGVVGDSRPRRGGGVAAARQQGRLVQPPVRGLPGDVWEHAEREPDTGDARKGWYFPSDGELRASPDGEEALRECVRRWPAIVVSAKTLGAIR